MGPVAVGAVGPDVQRMGGRTPPDADVAALVYSKYLCTITMAYRKNLMKVSIRIIVKI